MLAVRRMRIRGARLRRGSSEPPTTGCSNCQPGRAPGSSCRRLVCSNPGRWRQTPPAASTSPHPPTTGCSNCQPGRATSRFTARSSVCVIEVHSVVAWLLAKGRAQFAACLRIEACKFVKHREFPVNHEPFLLVPRIIQSPVRRYPGRDGGAESQRPRLLRWLSWSTSETSKLSSLGVSERSDPGWTVRPVWGSQIALGAISWALTIGAGMGGYQGRDWGHCGDTC